MALSEDLKLPRVELEVRRSDATIGRECHGPECTMQDVFAGQRVVIVYRNSRSTMEANPMSDVTEVARHRKLRNAALMAMLIPVALAAGCAPPPPPPPPPQPVFAPAPPPPPQIRVPAVRG